jgi:hypothetical protein
MQVPKQTYERQLDVSTRRLAAFRQDDSCEPSTPPMTKATTIAQTATNIMMILCLEPWVLPATALLSLSSFIDAYCGGAHISEQCTGAATSKPWPSCSLVSALRSDVAGVLERGYGLQLVPGRISRRFLAPCRLTAQPCGLWQKEVFSIVI